MGDSKHFSTKSASSSTSFISCYHSSGRSSSWTKYFEGVFNGGGKLGAGPVCSVSCDTAAGFEVHSCSSLVSDAASPVVRKNRAADSRNEVLGARTVGFKERRISAKDVPEDDLEDTASSPLNGSHS
ncbi:hypothetical protein SAY87_012121 [Trapa incisa]|uniref:Uncharacterized protein n=1 Tax=Trapa incisa TaxID=236973 RepID=A0AAN7JIN0_9MYRT|nr:hypothetical protein SAY87_012121 [Trapa incisa]